jgi:hypothetical protein
VLVAAVIQLYLIYLHGLTLWHHFRGSSPTPVIDATEDERKNVTAEAQANVSASRTSFSKLLASRKSVFCLLSILWLKATFINRVCVVLIMLLDVPVGVMYTYPESITEWIVVLGFIFLCWSYLVAGRIWLEVVSSCFSAPFCLCTLDNLITRG